MRRPAPLPQITDAPASAFARGWWAGATVGAVTGMGLAVLLGWLR